MPDLTQVSNQQTIAINWFTSNFTWDSVFNTGLLLSPTLFYWLPSLPSCWPKHLPPMPLPVSPFSSTVTRRGHNTGHVYTYLISQPTGCWLVGWLVTAEMLVYRASFLTNIFNRKPPNFETSFGTTFQQIFPYIRMYFIYKIKPALWPKQKRKQRQFKRFVGHKLAGFSYGRVQTFYHRSCR